MPGGGPEFAPPKTQASYRVIPLPQIVADVLASHIARHPGGQRELIDTRPWPTRAGLERAVFNYIEGWYNTRRRHSSLGYKSPAVFEAIDRGSSRRREPTSLLLRSVRRVRYVSSA
jgi:transposase InsO family protein